MSKALRYIIIIIIHAGRTYIDYCTARPNNSNNNNNNNMVVFIL